MSSSDGSNHLLPADATSETTTYSYDFADHVLQNIRTSKKTASISYVVTQKQEFDHWGRLKTNKHKVNSGAEVVLSDLNYNWKNDVIEKNLGKVTVGATTTYLQSLDYTYNAQGWLKTINTPTLGGTSTSQVSCATMPDPGSLTISVDPDNKDLFYLDLKYDVLQSGLSGTIQKSGNISQVIWRSRGRERQSYSLGYDYLDRMTTATYNGISDAGTLNNAGAYNENLSYDARGNITNLIRTGKYKNPTCWTDATIDNLTYTYDASTNRLRQITDAAIAPANTNGWNNSAGASPLAVLYYDVNGNLAGDPYKGITIQYNFLNLPIKFTFTGNKVIDILYNGSGSKLRKTVTDNGVLQYTQDYVSGIEYRSTSTVSLSLESIYHAEGRVFNTNVGTTSADLLRYEYTIKDHLGNARLTFTDKNNNGVIDVTNTSTTEILQENHYYPFGLNISGPWMDDAAVRDNFYQYNGKELNTDFGLGWNDYGARWYDAGLGRFSSIDRYSEKYLAFTPYQYAANNPLKYIDVNGDSIVIRVDSKNRAIYENGKVYNRDGTQYTGKGVKIKKDGTIKLKGFLKSTVSALDKIRTGGPVGNNLVSTLQSDKDMFVINRGNNKTVGRVIHFDPYALGGALDEKGGTARPAYIGLAHEMAHALDGDDGIVDQLTWIKFIDGQTAQNAEKYATHVENQIRAENGIPLREYYGEDGGKPVGRILIPGTRMSMFYLSTTPSGAVSPFFYKK